MSRWLPLVCAVALAACGGESEPRPAAAGTPEASRTATPEPELQEVVLCSGGLTRDYDEIAVERFNKAHDRFEASFKPVKGNVDRQRRALVRRLGSGCDVAALDVAWIAEFAAAGLLRDLTDHVDSHRGEFIGATPDTAYYDSRYWGVPRHTDAGLLYVRDQVRKPPRTWQEAYRVARARNGIVYQGAPYESLALNFLEIAYAAGGEVLTEDGKRSALDSPENLRALRFMRDGIVSGAAKLDVARFAEEEARVAFMRGRATLMRNWQYAHVLLDDPDSDVRGEFVAAPLPAFAGGKRSGVLTGGDLVVAEETRSPEAAMALVEFLTSEDEQERLAVDFYLPPVLKTLYESEALNLSIPPYEALREVLEVARPRPATPQWPRVSRVIYTTVNAVLTGRVSPQAGLRRAHERLDAILAS